MVGRVGMAGESYSAEKNKQECLIETETYCRVKRNVWDEGEKMIWPLDVGRWEKEMWIIKKGKKCQKQKR